MPSVKLAEATLVLGPEAVPLETLAAQELQRYILLLTGTVPPITISPPAQGFVILIGSAAGAYVDELAAQEILVQTVEAARQPTLIITGGSAAAIQWAIYAFLEDLGCGFYLGGDTLPAPRPDRAIDQVTIRRTPVFAVRGTLPWYNFLNSPTTWNPGDHRRFYDQLAKQGANFVGYHSYDWEPWAAYPGGWSGMRMGEPVATSGSTRYVDQWGAVPTATADYAFGTHQLFAHSLFGADCAHGYSTHAQGIHRQQAMLAEALRYARSRGIRTCLGFELSGDPDASENIQALRERLQHLLATYPLDYVWLWQTEGRGGGAGYRPSDTPDAARDTLAAHFAYLGEDWRVAEGVRISHYLALGYRILRELAPEVRLIVSGWGGDHWMAFSDFYAGLDETLPDDIIFSALDNIDPTFEPNVSAVYGRVKPARERWPIPWFESDGGGTRRDQWGPQPNVYAFAPLLDDAQQKGCQGFLGIHWRTRAIEEVAGYAFRRAWDPDLTPEAFISRFARSAYGPEVGDEMAALHRRLEEMGPRWTGAMGQTECGPFTWFHWEGHEVPGLDELPPFRAGWLPSTDRLAELTRIEARLVTLSEQLDPRQRGAWTDIAPAAFERLIYLLRTIQWVTQYDRAALQLWGEGPIEAGIRRGEETRAAGDHAVAKVAGHEALEGLASCGLGGAMQVLADNVTNQGELGVVATANGKAIASYAQLIQRAESLAGTRAAAPLAGAGWPRSLQVWAWSPGDVAEAGQPFALEVRALGPYPVRKVHIHYRSLGTGDQPWQTIACAQQRLAVYRGAIPAAHMVAGGLAYYVSAEDESSATVTAPLGFPALTFSATVVGKAE